MDVRIFKDIFDRNLKRSSILFLLTVFVCLTTSISAHDNITSSLMLGLPVFMLVVINLNEINPQWSDRVVTCLPVERNSVASARWMMIVVISFFFMIFLVGLSFLTQSITSTIQPRNTLIGIFINSGIWLSGLYSVIRTTDLIKKTGWIIHPVIQTIFSIIFGLILGGSLFIFVGLNALWNSYPIMQPILWICALLLVPVSYYLTRIQSLPMRVVVFKPHEIIPEKQPLPSFEIDLMDRWFAAPFLNMLTKFMVFMFVFCIPLTWYSRYTGENNDPMMFFIIIPLLVIGFVQHLIPIRLHVSLPMSREKIFLNYVISFFAISFLSFALFIPIWFFFTDKSVDIHLISLIFINAFYLYFLMNVLALEIENSAVLFPFIFGALFGIITVLNTTNTVIKTYPNLGYFFWSLFIFLAIFSPYQLWRTLTRSSNPYKQKISFNPQEMNHQQ